VTSGWFFLSTLNYDARSTTHQICKGVLFSKLLGKKWYEIIKKLNILF